MSRGKIRFAALISAIFVLFINICAFAKVDIPNHTDRFFINDYANVIDSETEDYIFEKGKAYNANGGPQVVVLTMESIDGNDLEDFSIETARKWGIGDKDADNGVLILLVMDSRDIRIEVGYGLEGVLNDGKCGRFIRNATDSLSAGDYSEGIKQIYDSVIGELEDPTPDEEDDDEYDESLLDDDDDEEDDDDDDDGKLLNPKMDKAITIMGIVTAVIIVIVIIYLALSVAGVFKFGGKKNSESQQTESQTQTESESESETQTETEGQMIDIRGMSVEDAQKAVDRLKLDLTVFAFETKQSDEKDGTILEQDVKAGDTVKRGSQINVVIAGKGDSTSEMVKIPSVIGKTKSSAKSTLESAGFSVTFEYGDYNDSVAADVVTAQSPSAKKQAAKGSTVTVTLSPGQKPITVPNVVGASQSHAESALAGAGLKYTYADSQYSDTVPAGSVISQTKSGETVAAGTTITLTLSKGKQEISTNVSKGISYSGEGTVVKAEYKLVGKSGTVYDKGSYENTSSFTVSGTMKEATGSIVVTWTVQTGETDEAGNPATVTLDPVTYSVP